MNIVIKVFVLLIISGYDCPLMKNAFRFACTIAGGTLTAVDKLISRCVDIAINWSGGWHHAQR